MQKVNRYNRQTNFNTTRFSLIKSSDWNLLQPLEHKMFN